MAFTHECILNKNTPEIREKLESLGIRYKYANDVGSDSVIKCRNGFYNTYQSKYYQSLKDMFTKAIDCGTNEELFLAIAAMRDDSDYMQWMTDGTGWCRSELHNWLGLTPKYCYESEEDEDFYKYFYKATVEELVQRFKK